MMRQMRAAVKPVIWVVIIAFGGWGVFAFGMDVLGGSGVSLSDDAVRVNGRSIDLQTYYAAVRNAQEQQRQQFGSVPVSLEGQRALEDAVMENLIQDILLREEFRRRGIRVTDEEIRQAAQNSPPPEFMAAPEFQTDGQFDLAKYRRYIANSDPSFRLALEARYRDEIPRVKLFEQLTSDLYVSDAELWQLYRDMHDSVEIRVVDIQPAVVVSDSEVTVTDGEINAYYRDNRAEFARPAVAYTSYVAIPRLTNAADSAEALDRVRALAEELDAGADFADLAERESADSTSRARGGDLGMQASDRFVPEFTEAARALRVGDVSEPVLTQFGYHLIKLEGLTRDSLHARHILIPIELAGEHLDEVDAKADSLDRFAAEQMEPGALDDVAAMMALTIKQAPPVLEGNRVVAEGAVVPDAGIWAFEAIPGETSQVIEAPTSFYLFRLDSLRAAGTPRLSEIQPAVRRAALEAKKWERAREFAREIAASLRGGQRLMDAALTHLLNARTHGPMTRLNPDPALRGLPKVVGAGFGLRVGEASGPIETASAIYLVETASKHLADSTAFVEQIESQRAQVLQAAQQERVRRFVLSLREAADVVDRRRELERRQRELEDLADENPNPAARMIF